MHIKDEGSLFEAPIEAVWKFVQSPELHAQSHRSARNQRLKPLGENAALATMEQNIDGTWVRVANRVTIVPPLGMAIEILEGPLAGSKMFNVYTPRGAKTGIDVYGEFVSSQVPASQLDATVRAFLGTIYAEDAAALRSLASSP